MDIDNIESNTPSIHSYEEIISNHIDSILSLIRQYQYVYPPGEFEYMDSSDDNSLYEFTDGSILCINYEEILDPFIQSDHEEVCIDIIFLLLGSIPDQIYIRYLWEYTYKFCQAVQKIFK